LSGSSFKKNLEVIEVDGEGRKDFKELIILNKSLKLGVKHVREYLFKTIDAFISELSCKIKEMKGVKNFEDFYFYDDPKRNQTVLFFPWTLPVDRIAFPNGDSILLVCWSWRSKKNK
jgi:hypothetical protein